MVFSAWSVMVQLRCHHDSGPLPRQNYSTAIDRPAFIYHRRCTHVHGPQGLMIQLQPRQLL